jgi:N-acetylglucosaminyl-diphospho-decaprenol L-rhamnosyltransferase
MNELAMPSVDVVIPVYNSPELTKRCINSVVTHIGQGIRRINIHDDASNAQTRMMLDNLQHDQIHVYHAPKNQGFGQSVNTAIARSDADFVLVLNSDTEVYENILPKLCAAFTTDPKLAVISPVHNKFSSDELSRYIRRPGGYLQVYRFQGHAFLIRRCVFLEIGGFDSIFGRGYYEDIDLGRRLDQQGWRIGVHPDVYIYHKGGGTFGRGRAYRCLMTHNRAIYLARYPAASRNVLLVSKCCVLTDVSTELLNVIEDVFRQGGSVHWLTPAPAPLLYCLHMRNSPASLILVCMLMLRGLFRKDKRISVVWILSGISPQLKGALTFLARLRKIEVISLKEQASKQVKRYR